MKTDNQDAQDDLRQLYEDAAHAFLTDIAGAVRTASQSVSGSMLATYQEMIYEFLSGSIDGLDAALAVVSGEQQVSRSDRFCSGLRHFTRQRIPLNVKERLAQIYPVRALYSFLVSRRKSGLKARITAMAAAARGRPACDEEHITAPASGPHVTLFDLDDGQMWILAREIVDRNLAGLDAAARNASHFEAGGSEPQYLFVSHLFPTTWAPTIRALNDAGIRTAWLGNQNIATAKGYGVLETARIPTRETFTESFLGTIIFMATTSRSSILLSGECYYGANWSGNHAWVLYTIVGAVIAAVRHARTACANNLVLMMYDGLKPVAVSGPTKNEISRTYRHMMRGADKIIYNSNTEMFGDYVQNAYGVEVPRLHFYRYSEPPSAPKPRRDLKHGEEIHMACITVCLAEFDEPSRQAAPDQIREILKQGIHFHYYCNPDDRAVKAFVRSLDSKAKGFFHAHPINKNQQELVDELHQYHVALNPSDHVPFAQGIVVLEDREYEDGMSVFWQSTVGTSFLVYSAAGLPFILPRGCSAATELLDFAALPVTFGEFKNLRRYLIDSGLEGMLKRADKERHMAHIDTHVQRLVEFIG